MANRIIDAGNIHIDNVNKDLIRKEFGQYFEIVNNAVVETNKNNAILTINAGLVQQDTTAILPIFRQTITASSYLAQNDFQSFQRQMTSLFSANTFIDHYFVANYPNVSLEGVNNFEAFDYESFTKVNNPLGMLNIYDEEDFSPLETTEPVIESTLLENFSFDNTEATSRKNLFISNNNLYIPQEGFTEEDYNAFIKINQTYSITYADGALHFAFQNNKMIDKLFSFLKRTGQSNLSFYSDEARSNVQVNTKDLTQFLTEFDTSFFVAETDEKFYSDSEEPSRFENQVLFFNAYSRVRELCQSSMFRSSFEQLLNMDAAPSYPMGLKIEKYAIGSDAPLQTIYITGPSNRAYLDTLISYDTTYRYKISQVVAVFGNQYNYSNLRFDESRGEAYFNLINRPSIQVLELPLLDERMVVTDIPTLPPEIEFFNESGKRNQAMIYFSQNENINFQNEQLQSTSVGYYDQLFQDDNISYYKVNLQHGTNEIAFSNKYLSNRFQIYRLDEKPTKIRDFENALLTTIGNPGEEINVNSFTDFIAPNRKYYYLFRSLTNFDIPSNPSSIFEVELIEDSDESYITYKEVKLGMFNTYRTDKQFKKFMQLKPNMEHLIFKDGIDTTNPDMNDISYVGDTSPIIWNKKFKIRITSKKTGKKFDLNLKFNLKDENSP
tara:strand:- start:4166 stop:6160 length:1995 start_codon:yes stop_codon:yes gene_type:complete